MRTKHENVRASNRRQNDASLATSLVPSPLNYGHTKRNCFNPTFFNGSRSLLLRKILFQVEYLLASASDFGLAGKEWHNKGYSGSVSVFVCGCACVCVCVCRKQRKFSKNTCSCPVRCVCLLVCECVCVCHKPK